MFTNCLNDASFRAILVQIVKEACPAVSCPATMEGAVQLQQEGHVASVCQVMVGPSVSIAVMRDVRPSHAGMGGYARKRQASRTFTANVPAGGWENGVSKALCLRSQYLHAPCQTAMEKPMMEFVIRNATHFLVVGMVVTAHWQ